MKIDGGRQTFGYDAGCSTDNRTLNSTTPDLSQGPKELKSEAHNEVPFNEIRVELQDLNKPALALNSISTTVRMLERS